MTFGCICCCCTIKNKVKYLKANVCARKWIARREGEEEGTSGKLLRELKSEEEMLYNKCLYPISHVFYTPLIFCS